MDIGEELEVIEVRPLPLTEPEPVEDPAKVDPEPVEVECPELVPA